MFRFKSDVAPLPAVSADDKIIRLGLIGFGIRGKQLMQGLGFATPEFVEDLIQQSKKIPQTMPTRILSNRKICALR